MSSAARCCASAAEPPLPQKIALPPARSASMIICAASATAPAWPVNVSKLRALSRKAAATRSASEDVCLASIGAGCSRKSPLVEGVLQREIDGLQQILDEGTAPGDDVGLHHH